MNNKNEILFTVFVVCVDFLYVLICADFIYYLT